MCRIDPLAIAVTALALAGCTTPVISAQQDAGVDKPAIADFKSCAKPHYPQADLQARHEGTVTLEFLVRADGKVADSKVSKSSGFPTMDEAARTAIAQCRFTPASKGGKAVDKWTGVQYVWTLN